MSTKIWATPIDLSLYWSAGCLFREEETIIISSSWHKKRATVQWARKYEPLSLICLSIDLLATCSEKNILELPHHPRRETKESSCNIQKKWVAPLICFFFILQQTKEDGLFPSVKANNMPFCYALNATTMSYSIEWRWKFLKTKGLIWPHELSYFW
jgi:hypothetical protein